MSNEFTGLFAVLPEVLALGSRLRTADVSARPWRAWALDHLDLMLSHGRDHYGPQPTPQFVAIIDVRTRSMPADPPAYDENYRVERRGRRSPGGANPNLDQALWRSLHLATHITGQSRYAEAADAAIDHLATSLVDKNGLFWWGWHRHIDLATGRFDGHLESWHELHAVEEHVWPLLWARQPAAVRRHITAMWDRHVVNAVTGEFNRHDDCLPGCDFAMTAGALIHAFAFQAGVSGERLWLDRALTIAGYHWNARSPITGLPPDRPNAGTSRFDGSTSPTSIPGCLCHGLLKAWKYTGERTFLDRAVSYLIAFDAAAWDAETASYWASIGLDGRPIRRTGDTIPDGYDAFQSHGHVDLWQPDVVGYDHPLAAAQAYTWAADLTGDPRLVAIAQRWAGFIADHLPIGPCTLKPAFYAGYAETYAPHGGYAAHYASTISCLIHLHTVDGQARWLDLAQTVAGEAIGKLWWDGLLRSHPAKPTCENVDGSGQLIYALLSLDRVVMGPTAWTGIALDNWM